MLFAPLKMVNRYFGQLWATESAIQSQGKGRSASLALEETDRAAAVDCRLKSQSTKGCDPRVHGSSVGPPILELVWAPGNHSFVEGQSRNDKQRENG